MNSDVKISPGVNTTTTTNNNNKVPRPCKRTEKAMEQESDGDTNCNWYQMIDNGIGGLGRKSTIGDHSNDSIITIGKNTEKSPGDLRRLAVAQTSMRNHQLMLV